MKLASKTAIVTGAARGIGFGIAQVLAREGARVIIADRDAHGEAAAASLRESGAQALFISCNIAEKTQVEALFSQAEEAFGPVDILVNNAGINRDAMLHKLTEADWDTVIDVNLKGTFLCMQQAAIRMRERGAGRIINIASASWLGNVGQTNYSASKAGVVGMTKTACRELAKKGVTVNAICPGFIDTDMTAVLPETVRTGMTQGIPAGRAGQPEDVAQAVAFFAAEQSSYLTGQVLCVDGGMAM